jgi:hypothetical protein
LLEGRFHEHANRRCSCGEHWGEFSLKCSELRNLELLPRNECCAGSCRLINLSERGLDSDRAHVMTEGIFAINIKFYQLAC